MAESKLPSSRSRPRTTTMGEKEIADHSPLLATAAVPTHLYVNVHGRRDNRCYRLTCTALCALAVNTRYLLNVKTEENHIVAKYATVDSSVNRLGSRLLEVGTIESLLSPFSFLQLEFSTHRTIVCSGGKTTCYVSGYLWLT